MKTLHLIIQILCVIFIAWEIFKIFSPKFIWNEVKKRYLRKKAPSSKKIKCDRKKFSQTDKWSILYIQEYRCNICKIILPKEGPEFDHIIPLQYKGPDRLTNLQALCNKCHADKTWKENINIQINKT